MAGVSAWVFLVTSYLFSKRPFMIRFLFQNAIFIVFLLTMSFGAFAQSPCCTYTLRMQDSYGDGWNGGRLQVYVNTVLAGTFSGENYSSIDTLQVCQGDSLVLVYSAGDYENENTYQLYDGLWNLLYQGGPTPQTGNVYSSTGNCLGMAIPGSNPCTAVTIDTGQCLVGNNTGYPGSGITPNCANYTGGDYWFVMRVPLSGNLSFETDNGSINDTGVAVWADSTCMNPHLLGCDDDGGNGYHSFLPLYELTPNQMIFVQVWGYGGETGTFQLCVTDLGTVVLDSSELPIVVINTLGNKIVVDAKVNCLMDIKYNGPNSITYVGDDANIYSGNIGIEIRGATSAGYPQPAYGFETQDSTGKNNNVSLLGMPEENDWVLLSNFNDRSLIRNTLSHKLFGEMGHYSVRTSLCEVLIDSIYKGIYVLGEKIKRDKNRVNIAKLSAADTIGNDLTGGYMLQQNYWDANNSFTSNYSPIDHPGFDVHFVYEYPKPDSMAGEQKEYIRLYVDSLENALYRQNFADPVTGYRKYLDVPSFIDYFLINELSRNADGFKKSVFFHKDKYSNGGKLQAGPVWDFDWAWKNLDNCSYFNNYNGAGWAHLVNDCPTDNYSTGWYIRLQQDSTFNDELRCAYENYRHTIFDTTYIFGYIDSIRTLVQHAQKRHFQKWPILGKSGPAPEIGAIATTYDAELDTLKAWITLRLQWLDENIPGNCAPMVSDVTPSGGDVPFHCFPNPGSGTFHFEGLPDNKEFLQMAVYDVTGKVIDRFDITTKSSKFDYYLFQKGVFLYTLSDDKALIQCGKLVVL